ncbi:hypothetical protein [Arthrobacter sp. C152]
MGNSATEKCIACLLGLALLSSCAGTPGGTGGSARTKDAEPVVENRVRIGEENWIVQPGQAGPLAEAGTVESIEITNGTDSEVTVPDAGLNNTAFRVIFNGCTGILKPGETCVVRGEWATTKVRDATLEVSVAAPDATKSSAKRGISVPLGMAAGVAPAATLPPTTRSTTEPPSSRPPSPTPSGTSGTATRPRPTSSAPKLPTGPSVGAPLKSLIPTLK